MARSTVEYYPQTWPLERWPDFSFHELRCRETDACRLDPAFMDRVQLLRKAYQRPMLISSGYRAPTHSFERCKARPGTHTLGRAVDVLCDGVQAYAILRHAVPLGFMGIGVCQRGAVRYLHLDDMEPGEYHAPRPDLWSY